MLGIVGAATIYVIRNVIPEESVYTSKKASVTLSSGVKTLLTDESKYPDKKLSGGERFCNDYAGLFKSKGKIDCSKTSDLSGFNMQQGAELPSSYYDGTNVTTSTGEQWIGLNQNFRDNESPIKILVDVNGQKKGKNKLGEDVVLLSLYPNGKIGEFEKSSTATGQQSPSGVDCDRCQFELKAKPNTCSASYKGQKYHYCASNPECNRPGGSYACCAYILNHYWDFSWNPWSKETRTRTTTDDLGNVCTHYCDKLKLIDKDKDTFVACTATNKGYYYDTYWAKTGFLDFLSSSKVEECTLLDDARYECCDYWKGHISEYAGKWGINGWANRSKSATVRPINKYNKSETCTLSCDLAPIVHEEEERTCTADTKYQKTHKYKLPGANQQTPGYDMNEIATCRIVDPEKACCTYMKAPAHRMAYFGTTGWSASGKTINDELGVSCPLTCSELTKETTADQQCSATQTYKESDKYYLDGVEITACRSPQREKKCCAYLKANASTYFGTEGWSAAGKTITDDYGNNCSMTCADLQADGSNPIMEHPCSEGNETEVEKYLYYLPGTTLQISACGRSSTNECPCTCSKSRGMDRDKYMTIGDGDADTSACPNAVAKYEALESPSAKKTFVVNIPERGGNITKAVLKFKYSGVDYYKDNPKSPGCMNYGCTGSSVTIASVDIKENKKGEKVKKILKKHSYGVGDTPDTNKTCNVVFAQDVTAYVHKGRNEITFESGSSNGDIDDFVIRNLRLIYYQTKDTSCCSRDDEDDE